MNFIFSTQGLLLLALLSLIIAWKIQRRKRSAGRNLIILGYIALVTFIVNIFTIAITVGLGGVLRDDLQTLVRGEKGVAKLYYGQAESIDVDNIIDYENRESEYLYLVRLADDSEFELRLEDSYAIDDNSEVGEQVTVYFDKETSHYVELSLLKLGIAVLLCIICLVLVLTVLGELLYAFGAQMSEYYKLIQTIGVYILLPITMIGFEAALIYAFFYGNEVPIWISGILLVCILLLGLAILGLLKQLLTKGLPTWKQSGDSSWSADWNNKTIEEPQYKNLEDIKAKKRKIRKLRKQGTQVDEKEKPLNRKKYGANYKKDY